MPATGTRNFLGEDSSDMPSIRGHSSASHSPSPSPRPTTRTASTSNSTSSSTFNPSNSNSNALDELLTSTPNSSVWSPAQQQDFIQALMNASASGSSASGGGGGAQPQLPQFPSGAGDPADATMDNPFAAFMTAQLGGAGAGASAGAGAGAAGGGGLLAQALGGMGAMGMGMNMGNMGMGMGMGPAPAKPKSKLQKVLPLLHLVAMWCLLAYFVLWVEPRVHADAAGWQNGVGAGAGGLWRRWASLGVRAPGVLETFRVHVVVRIAPSLLSASVSSCFIFFVGSHSSGRSRLCRSHCTHYGYFPDSCVPFSNYS